MKTLAILLPVIMTASGLWVLLNSYYHIRLKSQVRRLICFLLLLCGGGLKASYLNEVNTPYLIGPELAGFEVFQRVYYQNSNSVIFVRDHNMYLSLSPSVELGIKVPFVNNTGGEISFSRIGDVKFHINYATEWFKNFASINYFLEFNIGSGPDYRELTTHPMEAYGSQEWRTGLIFFKRLTYFSLHFNLFYVFRSAGEKTLFDVFDADTVNIFNKEAWKRGLGFNPKNENAFIYEKNFPNDNLEYMLAFNSDLSYPLVPFIEFTFSHDFGAGKDNIQKAPGAGLFRSQVSVGTKWLLADEHFSLKVAFILPVLNLRQSHSWGAGLGVRIDF